MTPRTWRGVRRQQGWSRSTDTDTHAAQAPVTSPSPAHLHPKAEAACPTPPATRGRSLIAGSRSRRRRRSCARRHLATQTIDLTRARPRTTAKTSDTLWRRETASKTRGLTKKKRSMSSTANETDVRRRGLQFSDFKSRWQIISAWRCPTAAASRVRTNCAQQRQREVDTVKCTDTCGAPC